MQTERWAKKKSVFLLCSAEVPPNLAKQSVQTERWAKKKKYFFAQLSVRFALTFHFALLSMADIRKFVDYKTKKTDNYKNVIVCY